MRARTQVTTTKMSLLWHVEPESPELELIAEHLEVVLVDVVQRQNVVIVQQVEISGHHLLLPQP